MTLDPHDFAFVADLLRRDAAIKIDDDKHYLVQTRLAPVARRHGHGSVGALLGQLRRTGGAQLRADVIEAMTTNETSFFRDAHPWEALEQRVLPELIERRRQRRALNIWSGACSSGQEPYSVAMLLAERFPQLRTWNVRIIASDISAGMLGRAAAARYSAFEVNRGISPRLRERYFVADGDGYQLVDGIREMVEFRALNLASDRWSFLPAMDIVFLRNVLIYFALDTKRDILRRVRQVLQPDGYLFLGSPETTLNVDSAFERVQVGRTSAYRQHERAAP